MKAEGISRSHLRRPVSHVPGKDRVPARPATSNALVPTETQSPQNRHFWCLVFAIAAFVLAIGSSISSTRSLESSRLPQLVPLGTNQLRLGDKIHFPSNPQISEQWSVLDLHYIYPDGEMGVLLQSQDGVASVQRAKVPELLVER